MKVNTEEIRRKIFLLDNDNNNNNKENSVNTIYSKNINNLLNSSMKTKLPLNNIYSSSISFLKKEKNDEYIFENSEKLNNKILNFSLQKPIKGHIRNLSNIDSSYPRFRNSFIDGDYLKNLNEFNIAESGTPQKERILNFSFVPRKVNQSSMDELSQDIQKKYENKVNIEAPSWPLFHEKYIFTLL